MVTLTPVVVVLSVLVALVIARPVDPTALAIVTPVSHPVAILMAVSEAAPAVIVPMLIPLIVPTVSELLPVIFIPFTVPAVVISDEERSRLRPFWVPAVVIFPVVTFSPLAVRVPAVWVIAGVVTSTPVNVIEPAPLGLASAPPEIINPL